jgi:outer membrane protein assembly factor BamB
MKRCAFAFALLLAACASSSPKTAMQVSAVQTPMPTPVRGEQTRALSIVGGVAINPERAIPRPVMTKMLAQLPGGAIVAARNGTAYYYNGTFQKGGDLVAFDLTAGTVAWRKAVDALSDSFVATPYGVMFQERPAGAPAWPLIYLDARTGAQRLSIPAAKAAGTIDGIVFAKNNDTFSYFALDAKTGEKKWGTYGAGMQIAGGPEIHDGMLLQPFINDGAILEGALYAFDPANGHAKWSTFANTPPLGYRDGVVYVDSTWFPEQTDNYIPLTVAAIDVRTGKKLDEFTYAPDPQQNAATYRNTSLPMQAHVAGGYVYLRVNGTWYRYDAEREPQAAHPSRLDALQIEAVFQNGPLLVSDSHAAYLASSSQDAIALRPLAGGALRAAVVRDARGDVYAVAGDILYRFDADGAPSAIGTVRCSNVQAVIPWPGNVAVICGDRELRFRDISRASTHLALQSQPKPHGRLVLHAFTIPPAPGFMHQWWVGPVAPWRDGGVVMVLDHGAMNMAGAIAFVSKNGTIRTVMDGNDLPPPPTGSRTFTTLPRSQWPPKPAAIAYDTAGNVWFNNSLWPLIYKMTPSGAMTSRMVGEAGPQTWRRGAIRLQRGPDGQVWYARTHPTPQIARADGTRTIPIPAHYGHALHLLPAPDGFWFISQTQLVRVTLAGVFAATPLPPQFLNIRTYPGMVATSAGDSVWIANGAYVARMNEHGVLAHYELPDATLGAYAMITGCDGSLYVAEDAPEVLHLRPGAETFDRYAIDYRQLDGFTRTPDCSIWFVEGSNMPQQHVGTLRLIVR